MGDAERHVRVALQLVDTAPRDSLPRIVRGHIGEAEFAIKKGNRRVAASELGEALRSLEESRVEELLNQLRAARVGAQTGGMEEAKAHLRAALRLLDKPPLRSLPPAVRNYISQAGRAVLKSHSIEAVFAIDEALLALETPTAEGE